jgi:deoxycytidine triphosphate deaminase
MILGVDKLLELVNPPAGGQKLVENLCEREMTNPEGCGFDLCLGKVHKIFGKGLMGLTERESAKSTQLLEFDPNKKQIILIQPGESFLVTTREKVNMPQNLTANMWLRSTLYRSGIILSGGNIAPGYCGELSFLLFNAGNAEMEIELGARIVHIMFFEIGGKTNSYRGQWSGGRVSTSKPEQQV